MQHCPFFSIFADYFTTMNKKLKNIWQHLEFFWQKFGDKSWLYSHDVLNIHFEPKRKEKRHFNWTKPRFNFAIKSRDDVYKYLFLFTTIVFAVLMPILSLNVGISNFEWQQTQHCALGKWFSGNELFAIRHVVSALFGWGSILLLGLFLMQLFNWRAAFFGAFFLFISPHFLGTATGNLIDVPFAFAYLLFFYQLFLFYRKLPAIAWKRLIFLTLTIVFATFIHVGGFLLIGYLFIFSLLYFLINNPIKQFFTKIYWRNLGFLLAVLLGITGALYLVDFLYVTFFDSQFVLTSPARALTLSFTNNVHTQQLFDGELIWSSQMPAIYLMKMLFLTTPFVILVGFALFFVVFKLLLQRVSLFRMIVVMTAFFYPLLYISTHHLPFTTGWTQALFLYPIVVMMAVCGYEALLLRINDRYTNFVIVCVMFLFSFMPLRHVVVNQPFTAVYFNEISGGIYNAYGNYEIDINDQTNKYACHWFLNFVMSEEVRHFKDEPKIVVATNGNAACEAFFASDSAFVDLVFCSYNERYTKDWDYYISFADGVSSYQLKSGLWPPKETFHTINVEKKPIVAFLRKELTAPRDSVPSIE